MLAMIFLQALWTVDWISFPVFALSISAYIAVLLLAATFAFWDILINIDVLIHLLLYYYNYSLSLFFYKS
jgi:hypothetical protein